MGSALMVITVTRSCACVFLLLVCLCRYIRLVVSPLLSSLWNDLNVPSGRLPHAWYLFSLWLSWWKRGLWCCAFEVAIAFRYVVFDACPSSYVDNILIFLSTRLVFEVSFPWASKTGPGRSPHVKAPTISPSSCRGTSKVALVNLVNYFLTISPLFVYIWWWNVSLLCIFEVAWSF